MSCTQYTQGHTPHDRLSYLINRLCAELDGRDVPSDALALAQQARAVIDGYDRYVERMSTAAPPVLDTMVAAGNATDWARVHAEGKTRFQLIPEMTAGGYEAVVLQQLAKIAKARNVLEIGMFTGTTTVALALVPTVEKVVTLELEAYLEQTNRPFFAQAGVSEKIDIRIGEALASLEELSAEGASFDMVFIDADKANYINYFHKLVDSGLLGKDGFIVVDNVAFKASPWAPDDCYSSGPTLDAFNHAVRNHRGVEVVMLPVEDGISLIRRKDVTSPDVHVEV
ncbi:SAM-dependent methyltransferase-like protein [Phanerochaete sordida]|uniref:SAM-dependent methyltransferase-like protein n=1 Tax=Phanerochaete sordida TaxID=48140 RepID=A0A9P3GFP4_9APHY|nr:SAM-dependent methyltransferase-like protein [Phanerochaete sordida]